jgi:hypothetical protein
VIIRYSNERTITVGEGLIATTNTTSVPGFNITTITAGTGNVSWT